MSTLEQLQARLRAAAANPPTLPAQPGAKHRKQKRGYTASERVLAREQIRQAKIDAARQGREKLTSE